MEGEGMSGKIKEGERTWGKVGESEGIKTEKCEGN